MYIKAPRTDITRKRISVALKGKPRNPLTHFWTEEELIILKNKYPTTNIDILAKELGHPKWAVFGKARRIGLKLTRPRYLKNSWAFIGSNPYREILSELELSYIAGIFDGEGCLNKAQDEYWRMSIVNTYYPLIEWLKNKIPYSRIAQHAYSTGNHKETWEWRLSDNCKIKAILDLLIPYLQVKQAKAQEAMIHIEEWMKHR